MKKILHRLLITVGSLALLLAAFHAVENIRGRRAWRVWKAAQEAAGHRYDLTAYVPVEVPDSDNFAAAPSIAEAVAGRNSGTNWVIPTVFTDRATSGYWQIGRPADYAAFGAELKGRRLETFLDPFQSPLKDLAEAAQRPASRFKIDYTAPEQIPVLLDMRARALVLRLRALARLQAGQPEAALEDVLTGLRVIRHFKKEPHLTTQLLRVAYVNLMMQPIWEGLQSRAWNDRQLMRLQEALAPIDLLASMELAWQFERNGTIVARSQVLEAGFDAVVKNMTVTEKPKGRLARASLRWLVPMGWLYQNLLTLDYEFSLTAAVLDSMHHVVRTDLFQQATPQRGKPSWSPYNARESGLPFFKPGHVRVARAQSGLDQAHIACALERHRLAKGAYPETLQALAPAFLKQVPHDLVGGGPLRYSVTGSGYQLYSVGWNGRDEGGQMAPSAKDPVATFEQADWVWAVGGKWR